jgi:hypothetical protein
MNARFGAMIPLFPALFFRFSPAQSRRTVTSGIATEREVIFLRRFINSPFPSGRMKVELSTLPIEA